MNRTNISFYYYRCTSNCKVCKLVRQALSVVLELVSTPYVTDVDHFLASLNVLFIRKDIFSTGPKFLSAPFPFISIQSASLSQKLLSS